MAPDPSESELTAREADLAERERRAASGPADPVLLAKLARERDALADARDAAADVRDRAALQRRQRAADRDAAASARDRRSRAAHGDADPGFPDRFLSGRDLDAAAGDRADALEDERLAGQDRQRAREDRQRAATDRDAAAQAADRAETEAAGPRAGMKGRTVIGQALGLLMARLGISGEEAFEHLVRESQSRNIKLREVARMLVDGAEGR